MKKENSTVKELFEYVRNLPAQNSASLKEILSSYNLKKITCEEIIKKITAANNLLILDARSEKEFDESHLPFAINFPVLNNAERQNVGLIYKKYSQSAALRLAMEYADPKKEKLKNFLKENNVDGNEIFVYCWRGGGRSGYLAKMLTDLGYIPAIITGGYKSYRKLVYEFFDKEFPFGLIEVTGLTGSGKTEILKSVSGKIPVIDLEDAAHHYSSLFGAIPYQIRNINPVSNQTAFEDNLFEQFTLRSKTNFPFLIESESKKVGRFRIPENLFMKMNDAPSIEIYSSMNSRIERIKKDYFENEEKGIEEFLKILFMKKEFFVQQLSKSVYEDALNFLNESKTEEFIKLMIENYYDKKYRRKNKSQLTSINNDDPGSAIESLLEFYKSYIKRKAGASFDTPVLK